MTQILPTMMTPGSSVKGTAHAGKSAVSKDSFGAVVDRKLGLGGGESSVGDQSSANGSQSDTVESTQAQTEPAGEKGATEAGVTLIGGAPVETDPAGRSLNSDMSLSSPCMAPSSVENALIATTLFSAAGLNPVAVITLDTQAPILASAGTSVETALTSGPSVFRSVEVTEAGLNVLEWMNPLVEGGIKGGVTGSGRPAAPTDAAALTMKRDLTAGAAGMKAGDKVVAEAGSGAAQPTSPSQGAPAAAAALLAALTAGHSDVPMANLAATVPMTQVGAQAMTAAGAGSLTDAGMTRPSGPDPAAPANATGTAAATFAAVRSSAVGLTEPQPDALTAAASVPQGHSSARSVLMPLVDDQRRVLAGTADVTNASGSVPAGTTPDAAPSVPAAPLPTTVPIPAAPTSSGQASGRSVASGIAEADEPTIPAALSEPAGKNTAALSAATEPTLGENSVVDVFRGARLAQADEGRRMTAQPAAAASFTAGTAKSVAAPSLPIAPATDGAAGVGQSIKSAPTSSVAADYESEVVPEIAEMTGAQPAAETRGTGASRSGGGRAARGVGKPAARAPDAAKGESAGRSVADAAGGFRQVVTAAAESRAAGTQAQATGREPPGPATATLTTGITSAMQAAAARAETTVTPATAAMLQAQPQAAEPLQLPLAGMQQRTERIQDLMARLDEHVLNLAGGDKDKTMTIQLVPENLGRVALSCRDDDGQIRVQLVVENSAVRNLLQQQEGSLRDMLQQSGYRLAQFDVRTQGEGAGARSFAKRETGGGRTAGRVDRLESQTEADESAAPAPAAGDGRRDQVWYIA